MTGASSGIGFAIASALAAEGASVAISSPTKERIEAAAQEIGAEAYVHDSNDLDAAPRLIDRVEADLGPLAVLVFNTGGPPGGEPLEFSREQWQAAYEELVLAPMAFVERVVPGMRERGFGRILNVSSSAAREPILNLMLSTTHRSGMLGAFKLLARRLAGDGITFNTLMPGRIATARIAHLYGSLEQAQDVAGEEIPAGRLGTVEEIGAAGAFLCSAAASYITGQALAVDGGLLQAT